MNWIDEYANKCTAELFVVGSAEKEELAQVHAIIITALQNAHTNGTQEALAKVEEWVNKNGKEFIDGLLELTPEDGYNEALSNLLHHLQQLKDNKTVTLEMNGSSGCGHIEYDTTCPHCHNIRTTTNTKTV